MTRAIAVLRPEPGNAATVALLTAAGLQAIALPLFETRAIDWTPPDPRNHDALLFTSANAVRLGGPDLDRLASLPVLAVGPATAVAARKAGFAVALVGTTNAAAAAAEAASLGYRRIVHVTGRDHVSPGGGVTCTITVYESTPRPISDARIADIDGGVALLHSARAAARFAALAAARRDRIGIAALSEAVAVAAGEGWARVAIASVPTDTALIAAAQQLAD
ncbi:uroporphyrinogen-III synthase [Sphingomonas koreensis]|nr:uroporphyrinogen-III synthase [Sphingomonas koreensis]